MTVTLKKNGVVRIVPEHKVAYWKNKGFMPFEKPKAKTAPAKDYVLSSDFSELKTQADKLGVQYTANATLNSLTKKIDEFLTENPDKKALLAE